MSLEHLLLSWYPSQPARAWNSPFCLIRCSAILGWRFFCGWAVSKGARNLLELREQNLSTSTLTVLQKEFCVTSNEQVMLRRFNLQIEWLLGLTCASVRVRD